MTKSAEPGLFRAAVRRGHPAEPCVSLILAIFLGAPLTAQTQSKAGGDATAESAAVTITLTEQNVTDKTLRLRYRISNNSAHDVWICKSMHALA